MMKVDSHLIIGKTRPSSKMMMMTMSYSLIQTDRAKIILSLI